MMRAASAAADEEAARASRPAPLVVAVTMLTSLDDGMLARSASGPDRRPGRAARRACPGGWARRRRRLAAGDRARSASACGADFTIVTPGIRGTGDQKGDQSRTMSAAEALRRRHYLVVGRPITAAAEPGRRPNA